MGLSGGQIGFDEGALFEVMAKPKRTTEKFTYNKEGLVIKKTTSTLSYWDAVMIAGGPALIFAMISSIKWIGQKVNDMMSDDEIQWYKDHPLIVMGLGPIGAKLAYEFVDQAEDQGKAVAAVSVVGYKLFARQIKENWGLLGGDGTEGWVEVPGGKESDWVAAPGNTIEGGEWKGYQLRSWTDDKGTEFQHWYTPGGVAIGDDMALAKTLFEHLAFWKPDAVAGRTAQLEADLRREAEQKARALAQQKAELHAQAAAIRANADNRLEGGHMTKDEYDAEYARAKALDQQADALT